MPSFSRLVQCLTHCLSARQCGKGAGFYQSHHQHHLRALDGAPMKSLLPGHTRVPLTHTGPGSPINWRWRSSRNRGPSWSALERSSVEPPRGRPKAQSNPGSLYRQSWGVSEDRYKCPRREILGIGCPLLPRRHSGGRITPTTGPTGQRPWLPRWANNGLLRCTLAQRNY
jgi:hypothetical protein